MTSTITCADYETERHASALLARDPTYARSNDQDAWMAVLKSMCSSSSGVVLLVSDYGPILPHIGCSSFVVDRRPARTRAVNQLQASTDFGKIVALSVIEQMQELLAALSLNKSQLAQILRVTRPTMYDWFQGYEPNAVNTDRLYALLRILARASVSSGAPLNARFVRQPMELDAPSIIDLLAAQEIDEERIVRAFEQARALGDTASRRRANREIHLRALGFEEPTSEQRRDQLAKSMALKGWPHQ
jgi:hypothetical protein